MTTSELGAKRPRTGYLPSLDGWRAIAVLSVLFQHDPVWPGIARLHFYYKQHIGFGVPLFFTISGLLITTRILEEEALVGFFDLRGFYIRRFFRIQPAAWGYLATTGILIAFGVLHEHWFYWIAALLLFENFTFSGVAHAASFFSGHFWTLAVEEHFYILLSLLLYFCRRHRFWLLAGAYIALEYSTRFAHIGPESGRRTYWQLYLLIAPAAAAVALRNPTLRDWVQQYLKPWCAFSLTLVAEIVHQFGTLLHLHRGMLGLVAKVAVHNVLHYSEFFFTLWIVATVFHRRSWTTRLLETAPLRFIGRLSYSLYLWHVLFFFREVPATGITNPVLLALSGRPARYFATLIAACVSYFLLEKPMMRLGHRIAPPATPGRLDLVDEPTETTTARNAETPSAAMQ